VSVRPPTEFDFPLSWAGPEGIGASPFDEVAEAERPDVEGDDPDRFAGRATNGAEPRFEVVRDTPLADGALAHFVARVERSYWGGDHSLFLGRVEYARQHSGAPLLFHGGRYVSSGSS
jgi:flavin reductase (DIM6/NTAB) family NADH-FMN oxidoreductase RutF